LDDECEVQEKHRFVGIIYKIALFMSSQVTDKPKNAIIGYFLEMIQDPNSVAELKKFAIGLVTLTITCAVFYTAYYDKEALTNKFYLYCVFGLFPIFIGILLVSKIFNEEMNINKMYFYGIILFIMIISINMFYRIMNPTSVSYVSYLINFVFALMFIVGLAIVYRIFVRTIVNVRGWIGFFLRLLFLIPCLLIDVLEALFIELKSSSNMVIALFIIETIIILAYLYMPRFVKSAKNSVVLLDKPVFLSRSQAIGRADKLFIGVNDKNNPGKDLSLIRQNYSLSMWFYVNQHSTSNAAYSKETDIFRYGVPNRKHGHPRVSYFNDTSDANNTDKFIVYPSENAPRVSLNIPTQSWNQLVIVYNGTIVDIFVNGNLEKTVTLSSSEIPKYNTSDIIEVGEGDNTNVGGGLHGAICNVVYHKTPLTAFKIAGEYNLNRYKNPPTYN
jgi:hypothetical protein